MSSYFITGIGTGVGKTLVAAIVTEALQGSYWKPIQAGFNATDTSWVQAMTGRPVHPEAYALSLAASPHIAAREEGLRIDLDHILACRPALDPSNPLIIEGAGGLLVPLNEKEFVLDLARRLDAPIILVSRNYLGSINHSLLTAEVCKAHGLRVAGWIFNDQYVHNDRRLHYEEEIAAWTGFPALASIPHADNPDRAFVRNQAERIRPLLQESLSLPRQR
jgi:dethiobiotin synthetase